MGKPATNNEADAWLAELDPSLAAQFEGMGETNAADGAPAQVSAFNTPTRSADSKPTRVRVVVVTDDDLPPVKGVDLPTVTDPEVEITDRTAGNKKTKMKQSEVLKSPDYIDNGIKSLKAQPTQMTLEVKMMEIFYAKGGSMEIKMDWVKDGTNPLASTYVRKDDMLIPVDKNGAVLFDGNNTPNILICYEYIKQEMRRRSAERVEIAEIVAAFASAVAALGGAAAGAHEITGGGGGVHGGEGGEEEEGGQGEQGAGGGEEEEGEETGAGQGSQSGPPPTETSGGGGGGESGGGGGAKPSTPPAPPTSVTDAEVVATNAKNPASIKPQDPKSHQQNWEALGGKGPAPSAYRDREGNVRISTDHVLLKPATREGISPVTPSGTKPSPKETKPAPAKPTTPAKGDSPKGDIGTADTAPPPKPKADPQAKTPATPPPPEKPPAERKVSPGAETGDAGETTRQPQAPKTGKAIDPPQAISQDAVRRIQNQPPPASTRKGAGSGVRTSVDHDHHQLAWQRLGGHGEAPPAFIYDGQVYLDPSRWPPK